jgi:hypothetical protein
MSSVEPDRGEGSAALSSFGNAGERQCNRARDIRVCWRWLAARAIGFAVLCVFSCNVIALHAQEIDFTPYREAADYCRGDVPRPMALSPDNRILCLDGRLSPQELPPINISLADQLADGGIFVVRSRGGIAGIAASLAEKLKQRGATVVAHDYCLSACASVLLVASTAAFVLGGTLVAWHNSVSPYSCPEFEDADDHGPKRLVGRPCPDAPPEYKASSSHAYWAEKSFFSTRTFGPFQHPPQSNFVRKALKSEFERTGTHPANLLWTWHPRHYPGALKTKIIYEAYPKAQEEVDALAVPLHVRVIYDP